MGSAVHSSDQGNAIHVLAKMEQVGPARSGLMALGEGAMKPLPLGL